MNKKEASQAKGNKFSVSFPAFSFIELTQKQIHTVPTFAHCALFNPFLRFATSNRNSVLPDVRELYPQF